MTNARRTGPWRAGLCSAALALLLGGMPGTVLAQDAAARQAEGSVLNFAHADIDAVIAAVGDYTGIAFIVDPQVKGSIDLISETPVSKARAFEMLASVLRLHGYAVVRNGQRAKVVLEANAKQHGAPVRDSGLAGDEIVTRIFHLNHESAAGLVAVLRPLISPNNTITANMGSNTLVVTDYADNLDRISKIISALDDPAGSAVVLVPVHHAIASDLAALAGRLLEPDGPKAASGDNSRLSLLADPRTNAVAIRAPSAARAELARALIEQLDQPTEQPGNVHVVYLRNAEATKLAKTLRAVMTAGAALPAEGDAAATTVKAAQDKAGTADALQSGYIQADAATNTLIITASEPVYRNLRRIIDQLDARRAQVYIESLIVEVTAQQAASFGVQWANLNGDSNSVYRVGTASGFGSGGDNLINQAVNKAATGNFLPPGNGLNIGIFKQAAGQIGLGALAQMLETKGNANILSMPNMITLDNEEAKIIVGQNVPFLTGQYATTASGSAAGVNPFQTIERKDIGLSLKVRPQISEGGTVKLAIYQEISSVQDLTAAAGIITNKRAIDTNVLVDDGQIIVLGGLIDETLQDNVEKVQGLGDIPIFGNLFSYKKRSRVKTNLMVFLRPIVVRDAAQSAVLASDRYDYIRRAEIQARPDSTLVLPDMHAPELPPLQDGEITGDLLFNRMDRHLPTAPAAAEGGQ